MNEVNQNITDKYLLPTDFRLFDISHISKKPMDASTHWVDVINVNDNIRWKK
jgi:hypothetical protein